MQVGEKKKQGKDTFTLIRLDPEVWSKENDGYAGQKTFFYYPCQYCGKLISNCGFASAHYAMHARKNETKKRYHG
ncbi:MAG: hypothetical protein PHT07_21520 [Paludibacter sp.]|nr:hypothetical protein [Paludibacter sp.]